MVVPLSSQHTPQWWFREITGVSHQTKVNGRSPKSLGSVPSPLSIRPNDGRGSPFWCGFYSTKRVWRNHSYMCMCLYIYIYLYISCSGGEKKRYVCIYICIYIYHTLGSAVQSYRGQRIQRIQKLKATQDLPTWLQDLPTWPPDLPTCLPDVPTWPPDSDLPTWPPILATWLPDQPTWRTDLPAWLPDLPSWP